MRESTKPKRVRRDDLPIHSCVRYRCPQCDGTRFRTLRSTRDDDGVSTQEKRCERCGYRFILVVE